MVYRLNPIYTVFQGFNSVCILCPFGVEGEVHPKMRAKFKAGA